MNEAANIYWIPGLGVSGRVLDDPQRGAYAVSLALRKRGHSLSQLVRKSPVDSSWDAEVERATREIGELAASSTRPLLIVGHSIGAWTAARVAQRLALGRPLTGWVTIAGPELPWRAVVDRAVRSHGEGQPQASIDRRCTIELALLDEIEAQARRGEEPSFSRAGHTLHSHLGDELLRLPQVSSDLSQGHGAAYIVGLLAFDLLESFGASESPSLHLSGRGDALLPPSSSQVLANARPPVLGSSAVIEGLDHALSGDAGMAAEALAAVIDEWFHKII